MIAEPDQVALLACYALVAFAMHETLSSPNWRTYIRTAAPHLALASTVCLVLVSMPLLFTILFAEASNRPQIHLSEALLGSLHPASLLTLGVSDLYGAFSRMFPIGDLRRRVGLLTSCSLRTWVSSIWGSFR